MTQLRGKNLGAYGSNLWPGETPYRIPNDVKNRYAIWQKYRGMNFLTQVNPEKLPEKIKEEVGMVKRNGLGEADFYSIPSLYGVGLKEYRNDLLLWGGVVAALVYCIYRNRGVEL